MLRTYRILTSARRTRTACALLLNHAQRIPTARALPAVFLSIFCSACAVVQPYQRPAIQAPATFREIEGSEQWKTAIPGDGVMKGKWWEIYGDPALNRLEEQVSTSNYNVKQLEAVFRESIALIEVSRAGYYPTVTTTPGATQSDRGPNAG